ncbi:DUF4145 domain-containing protein [Psychrobacter immobilis]|uniref:DUF4145 domain-containing protein n=1 Tax=Psychrobacter immobilis TaxID=498 RepID=UPI001918C393|nr:DUF4145 domain-containing protein [Psychrobacter immobilis]
MSNKKVRSYCRSCGQSTNHNILAEQIDSFREDYEYDQTYQILECLGCDTKSFRDVLEEIQHAFQISQNEWEVPTSITVYPRFIKDHRSLDGEYHLPVTVRQIYKEVLLAFQEEALILAGLGLRGTVEAVCNDLKVTGRDLEIKISKLATAGYISRRDAERLHGIRFMGNDAAHKIKKPNTIQLSAALKIVEHMLLSVYILEEQIQGNIDTLITEFMQFEKILNKKLEHFNSGDEVPIMGIFGSDIRRIKNSLPDLEAELIKQIDAGTITNIKKGKIDKYEYSKHDLQHFIL